MSNTYIKRHIYGLKLKELIQEHSLGGLHTGHNLHKERINHMKKLILLKLLNY